MRLWDTELLAFWDHECCRVGLEVPQEECYEPIPSQLREDESERTNGRMEPRADREQTRRRRSTRCGAACRHSWQRNGPRVTNVFGLVK